MNNDIFHTITRKGDVMNAAPQRHSTLRQAAQSLSLKNVDMAICELLNEALARTTMLCYERDDTGAYCNIDEAGGGRILIPLPWGRAGHAKWGLSPSEANVLRLIMFTRQKRGVGLYLYDRSRKSWYVNLEEYVEMPVLKEWEIGIAELRTARSKLLGQ